MNKIKERFKKTASFLARIGMSIVLLALLFKFNKIDLRGVAANIRNADSLLLFSAFIIFFSTHALMLFRWEMLLKAAGIRLPLKRVIISFAGGTFFNLFLPSTIGGDLTRSIDLAAHTQKPKEVLATVFMDRLSGYMGLVIVALFFSFIGWDFIKNDRSILLALFLIVLLLAGVLTVLFNTFLYAKINKLLNSPTAGKVREVLKGLHHEIHIFRHRRKSLLYNLIISVLVQAVYPVSFYLIALSLGVKINIIYFFILIPIIGAISLLPISIGGLGVRENMTVLFFAKAGMCQALALSMSLLAFFFILINAAAGGLIYVLTVHHRRIQHH